MGNICSVCAKKNKYVDKKHEPDQDANNKHSYQVATNQGVVLEMENQSDDRTTFKSTSSSVPKPTDGEKSTPKNGEAANFKQGSSRTAKAKKKKKQPLTDSSETSDSSSESDSSDSDGICHQGSCHRAYKNHKGGTTMISKKVVVAGNYMNIGHGAKNVVLNIDSTGPKVKPSKPVQKTRYEAYDRKAWGDHASFVYLSETSGGLVEGIDVVRLLGIWEKSICRIKYPAGSGSGFRVGTGDKYLLCTAYHVYEAMVRPGPASSIFDRGDNNPESQLDRGSVWCVFNHIQEDSNVTERDKFYFKPVCHYFDLVTDIAILELYPNQYGTEMPLAFTSFGVPNALESFHLIGHPDGGKKLRCKSENIINMLSPVTSNHINIVRRWHTERQLDFDRGLNNRIDNPSRWLFHVTDSFTKGASGCPGLVVVPPLRVSVVTVLLRGYPDWFYEPKIPWEKKAELPEGFRVEQGANMDFVIKNMKRDKPALCREIFNL